MNDNLPSGAEQVLVLVQPARSKHDKAVSNPTEHADNRALAGPKGYQIVASHEDDDFSGGKGKRGPDLEEGLCLGEELRAQGYRVGVLVQHPERIGRGDAINAAYLIEHVPVASQAASQRDAVHAPDAFRQLKYGVIPRERKVGPTRLPVAERSNAIAERRKVRLIG